MEKENINKVSELLMNRHSIRKYKDNPISKNEREELYAFIEQFNKDNNTNFQIIIDEPEAFKTKLLGRIAFKNVTNYVVLYHDYEETAGYLSVPILVKLLEMGYGTCYVGATYNKSMYEYDPSKKVQCLIAFGYPDETGKPHKNKPLEELVEVNSNKPAYFDDAVKAALSAPTAMNLQRFKLTVENNEVKVILTKDGAFAKFDLGIIRGFVDLVKSNYKD